MDALKLPAAALLLLLLSLNSPVSSNQFPDSKQAREWANHIEEDLLQLINAEVDIEHLTKVFNDLEDKYKVEHNNAQQLVANAASNIDKLLANRSKALEALATAAEKLQVEHQWRDDFEEDYNQYYNAKDDTYLNNTLDFIKDPAFKRLVSYNSTAVHIPTDIYEGSTIVLNELNWTQALDEVFKKNKEEDPTLLWQVFGSATGLARYFPASPWIETKKTAGKIDLYDVRRRPWYIQGAASPKDMLILVDASGSVSGLTLKLIRTSVSEMLETLSDDDYVNVVFFSNEAKPAACFQNLVQANVRNKKILKKAVQNITANGTTDYKKGFKMAFEQLDAKNNTRANCNKIIMLFTDGGEDRASEVFEEMNKARKVRIFTFSVGQHNYDKGPIQWMACTNKGYYYEIPSIGAIRINTQEYLDVLGRPMVKADKAAKKVQWTNVYQDALELGLVITGTLPVFNKTGIKTVRNKQQLSNENQLILGVMAIDVSLNDIKRLTPRYTFGPNGYYFAIDPNGYVLLHPNLQPENNKFQEPVTLDFLDAELENEIKVEIRMKMIKAEKGQQTIYTLVKSQDERYIDQGLRTYTYGPVNGTDYSLALVLPDYSQYYIKATLGDTITQAKFSESLQVDKFEEYGYTFIAPREYCNDLKPQSSNNTEFLIEFNKYIDMKTPNDPQCNVDLVNRLLLDAGITSKIVKHWTEQNRTDRIRAKFVATDGGITRVYPTSAGFEWSEEPETYNSSFYKRTLDNDIYIFTPPLPEIIPSENGSRSADSILVSKAVNITIKGATLKPAVVGAKIDIVNWMQSFTNAAEKSNCNDEICGCKRDDPNIDCVLLDDGGFLVMSNQNDYISQIGQFFGVIDPMLMLNLLNESLFSFNKTYDYQAVCFPTKENRSAAGLRSVYVPTIADILNVGWLASAAAWSILQQLFVSITFPNFLEAAEPEDDAMEKESCITEQTQYFFANTDKSFKGSLECDNCSRQYIAEKLVMTNLVLIIADSKKTCTTCHAKPLTQAEQPSSGPDPCELAKHPRYRKGPEVCFDNNANERDVDCGGASGLTPPVWLMAIFQLLLLWLLSGLGHCPS
ncbi:voltage-dependent calcium channel subunit alpha-2/delta-1a [Astyanax mexicanus]|uniref:voltage-dependent calcium channel subunit alpha-2/delta-1a n=1 Tax=Astyanax mexicanus TaxID=7994 RepID=UPI0020CB49FC|nr:voltage-dependent calcium channel subunit alpha-2/delta-1a [Astyanax mexicanus]